MSTPARSSPKTRRWLLLGVLALVAALGWWLSRPEASPLAAEVPPDEPSTPATAGSLPAPAPPVLARTEPAPERASPAPLSPIVDEVLVEKQEVCSGEENLITVRAHTPDGNDAYLHYTVGNNTGQQVPLRVWRNDDGTYEVPPVTVFSKDNVATTVPVPRYTVKDCEPERLVQVLSRRLPNGEDDFELMAKVVERPVRPGEPAPRPFRPVRYEWSFDGGPPKTTGGPLTEHTFSGVPGDGALYSQHLIRVDVYDAAGKKATGRSSLQRLNTSFENLDKKGIVTLFAVGTPRFPSRGEDGVVRQTFRIHHQFKGPVRLTKVTALRAFIPTADGPPSPEQVDAATLPVDTIPEGPGVEVKVALDLTAEPDTFALTYVLEGTSATGRPAHGTFTVMRPPPRPSKENSTAVTDPLLRARILKARELLQQEYVTDEDLFRLEREGRFVGLKAEPSPSGATAGKPPHRRLERPPSP
ncbi:hypothetical protein P2318_07295 [Myxococcaceae bacterium GXIMD 01537]